jgi:alkaline phosphatase D
MRCIPVLLYCALLSSGAGAADTTIAFGSCLRQWNPAPILDSVRALKPDLFIFAGDNVYSDNGPYRYEEEPERIALAYMELGGKPRFEALRQSTRLLATWDDHDYGRNNAGAEYPWKQAAKEAFMEFFDIADDAPVRQHPGVYSAHDIGPPDSRIQVVLLDTRSFRGPLRDAPPDQQCPDGRLVAVNDSSSSLLGEQQWAWLEDRLREPAALRLIVSSIQVIPDRHCFEKWGNFPRERARLLKQVAGSGVRTVFLSGDRHLGEISMLPAQPGTLPLYEVTASGLNAAGAGRGEYNPYRVTRDNVRVDHFGVVRYRRTSATVELALHDTRGTPLQQYFLDYPTWLLQTPESIALPQP